MDNSALWLSIGARSSPRSVWCANRTSRRRHRAGVVRSVFGGQRHSVEFSEAPLASPSSVPSWKSALECGFDSRLAHQSGLHGQAVYWSKSIPAGPHPAVRHPSFGQPGTRAGFYAARGVDLDWNGAGPGQPGGFRASAGEIGSEQEASDTQQQALQLLIADQKSSKEIATEL